MVSRTWRNIPQEKVEEIKELLLRNSGEKIDIKSDSELWRIKILNAIYIMYRSRTLYRTPSEEKFVIELDKTVDNILGNTDIIEYEYFIGLDETGKGEVFGNIVLVGVLIPADIKNELHQVVGSADTKSNHQYEYWQKIYDRIMMYGKDKVKYAAFEIYPALIDEYNLNQLMDVFYAKIIIDLLRKVEINKTKIIIDDYGVGEFLKGILAKINSNVVIERQSEDKYIETRLASIIAKTIQTKRIRNIFSKKEYHIDEIGIPSGNLSDKKTIEWLRKWHENYGEFPWFVRKSYKTVREIEKIQGKLIKKSPTLCFDMVFKPDLKEFLNRQQGNHQLIVKCSHCGGTVSLLFLKSVDDKKFEYICALSDCGGKVDCLEILLLFYFDYVLIDIDRKKISIISQLIRDQQFPAGLKMIINNDIYKTITKFEEIVKPDLIKYEIMNDERFNYNNTILLTDKQDIKNIKNFGFLIILSN